MDTIYHNYWIFHHFWLLSWWQTTLKLQLNVLCIDPLCGGGGKAEFILTTSISLFISSFHFNFLHRVARSGGKGDSVVKHVNLRKSVCYDEKWVGVGGRPRPLMLRACILHGIQYACMHEISLNEIKRSLSFYKMQNYNYTKAYL